MKEGWSVKQLKDCGIIQTGTTPPSKEKDNYGDFIPFIKPSDFNLSGKIENSANMLSEKGLKKGRYYAEGTVLMVCIGATIGKAGYIEIPASSNQQINAITPFPEIDYKYLYYSMISPYFQQSVLKQGKSAQATLPIINKTKWGNIELPIPPISEQKQIIEKLDKAFAAIDQAKANIERNIENAKELFQSKLNEIFSQKGEGWEEKKLGEVCQKMQYGSSSKSVATGDVVVLRMGNIQNFEIDWSDLKYSNDKNENEKYQLVENDVLFNRTNSPELVGKSAIYRGTYPSIYAGYLINVKYKKNILNGEYLNYYLNCDKTREYGFSIMSSSVNQANISASKLKEYKINFPSIEDQLEISARLKKLKLWIDEYITNCNIKLSHVDQLKKSILQKAIQGEL